MSSGHLSLVLKRQKGISLQTAEKICEALSFNKDEQNFFIYLVKLMDSKSQENRISARDETMKNPFSRFLDITDDYLKIISEWHHFAILELIKLKDLSHHPKALSARLGISLAQTQKAIKRLEFLGYIFVEENGEIVDNNYHLETTEDIPSQFIQKQLRGFLEIAKEAITKQPVESRDFSNLTFAIPSDEIPRIKKKVQKFRDDLADELILLQENKASDIDSLYALSLNLFKLDQ